jgi:hypothetical protein
VDAAVVQTGADPRVTARLSKNLNRAREALTTPSSPLTWWTGSLVEAAWQGLNSVREDLVLVEEAEIFRAEAPYFAHLAAQAGSHATTQWDPSSSSDRAAAHQLVRTAHIATAEAHQAVRGFRNFLVLLTVATALATVVGTIIDGGDRAAIAVGALAGVVATVLPLSTATSLPGPYGLTTVQALLRVPSGCVAALLSVILLRSGLAGFAPAVGNTALFYAALFGFGQTALLKLLDTQADSLQRASAPQSSAAPSSRGSTPG